MDIVLNCICSIFVSTIISFFITRFVINYIVIKVLIHQEEEWVKIINRILKK